MHYIGRVFDQDDREVFSCGFRWMAEEDVITCLAEAYKQAFPGVMPSWYRVSRLKTTYVDAMRNASRQGAVVPSAAVDRLWQGPCVNPV